MNILYYTWQEVTRDSCIKAFEELGHKIYVSDAVRRGYDYDEKFMSSVNKTIDTAKCIDLIFSFDYFPDLSRIANEKGLPYISWVYDCPHRTLQSHTVNDKCNRIFVFDRNQCESMQREGITTVFYQPLPARIIRCSFDAYNQDVSFLGSLYDGGQDDYGRINSFPEKLRGYLDGIINAQHNVYGADLISELVTDDIYNEISQYVSADLGSEYRKCGYDIFTDIMRKRVTMIDRIEALNEISKLDIDARLYSGSKSQFVKIKNMGYVDYNVKMPEVFQKSRINLNISLRSIRTGIPLRVMDILGAGGFCISNYQSEYDEYFDNGKDLVWYYSRDELVDLIDYYLANDDIRVGIARNGQKKAMELFSYKRLLEDVINKAMTN